MATARRPDRPAIPAADATVTYQLDVIGHLDDHWSEWLGGRTLIRNDDGTTTLTLEVADQAQLHGALTGIRDLGVSIRSLAMIDETSAGAAPDREPPPDIPGSPSPC